MESFGQTDTLADYREDVITQHQICYAISGLLSTWLDCHPEVFLEPMQHPCLQGLLAHLRLHMRGSDEELHFSHSLAQLVIQDFRQDEALARTTAPVSGVTPTSEPHASPSVNVATITVGGASSGAQAEATSALKLDGRSLGAETLCVEEEPRAKPALLQSPEGTNAPVDEVQSSPTFSSVLSVQEEGVSAELEPNGTSAPGMSVGEVVVGGGEMELCSSSPPVLRPHHTSKATAEEEPASTSPLPQVPGQAAFCDELNVLLPLAVLLYIVGAPAGLLSLVGVLTLVICGLRPLCSCDKSEPAFTRDPFHGANGPPAGSADRKPFVSLPPTLRSPQPAYSAELTVFLFLNLLLFILKGPAGVVSLVGVLTLVLCAVRSFCTCTESKPAIILAAVHSAQRASEYSAEKEPCVSLADNQPAPSTELEFLLSLSLIFYLLGAPALVLLVLGVPTVGLWVVRSTALHKESGPSANLAPDCRADRAPLLGPAEPASSSELHILLPIAAMLSLAQTPGLAICAGGALVLVLSFAGPPTKLTQSRRAELKPGSTMAVEPRTEDTAASRAERESPCTSTPLLPLQKAAACNAEMEASCVSAALLHAQGAAVASAATEPPSSAAPPICVEDTLASRNKPEPHPNLAQGLSAETSAACNPSPEPLAVVTEQAPSASWESELPCTSVPAQEACHPALVTRQTSCSQNMPCFLAVHPHLEAEQLTMMDAELFEKAVPNHCLGSIWSQRHKKGKEHLAPTIRDMVAHFNNVCSCVKTTCLGDFSMKAPDRARVVEHWIQVAAACRDLRNFSSLHAIISALQSTAIFRLKTTWQEVSRDSLHTFHKLEKITSPEKNYSKSRELLQKESCKLATKEKQLQGGPRWLQKMVLTKGIIPYLGIFLTDLMMIHSAYQDIHDEKSQMEKLNKENEIIQHLKDLQHTCTYYHLNKAENFLAWFKGLERLSEEASYELSCALEPRRQTDPTNKSKTFPGIQKARKNLRMPENKNVLAKYEFVLQKRTSPTLPRSCVEPVPHLFTGRGDNTTFKSVST
ncbi:uncharacterized protein [Dipodomys merriami]|uniref:uncharacterized protein n=1 Tax=Dipodomys merriami TaxID=94247 RepID=UPI003850A58C